MPAFLDGDVEIRLNVIVSRMISVMDTRGRDDQKENFYHGLLLRLLRSESNWLIQSDIEPVEGFSDIMIGDGRSGGGIEVKCASSVSALGGACVRAMV